MLKYYHFPVIWLCADSQGLIDILLHAQQLDMTNGDFVYIYPAALDEWVSLFLHTTHRGPFY